MTSVRFERFEYKYFVPESRVDRIRRFIAPYVVHDAEAGTRDEGAYTITNLYLDSPDFALWHRQAAGSMDRYKLRVRTYGADADGPIFFEVKRKLKDVVVKTRGRCPRAEYDARVRGVIDPDAGGENAIHLADFQHKAVRHGAEPKVLIRYEREAYESAFGDYARLTFDRGVRFQPACGFDLRGEPGNWQYLDTGLEVAGFPAGVLIELKFTRHVPVWMFDLVRTLELVRTNASKYFECIRHLMDGVRVGLPSLWRPNPFL